MGRDSERGDRPPADGRHGPGDVTGERHARLRLHHRGLPACAAGHLDARGDRCRSPGSWHRRSSPADPGARAEPDSMSSPRIREFLAALSLEEKATLTAGRDLWSTAPVERLGIPAVGLTDGPNGARGMGLPGVGMAASACTPCGAGLGATWDVELLERVGALIGREARAKGCHVLLAPTVNIHRSPLGGRTFEAFSEDPFLSGRLAVGYIRGVQSQGVAATVKHLAGNESERERMTADSVIDERTLREIYLLPFEMAVRDGRVRRRHDRVQPAERHLVRRERTAAADPSAGVGFRRPHHDRLVRRRSHRHRHAGRAEPRDARARDARSARPSPRRSRKATSTSRPSAPLPGSCSKPSTGQAFSTIRPVPAVDSPRTGYCCVRRRRRAACCSPTTARFRSISRAALRRGPRAQRGPHPDRRRRIGAGPPVSPGLDPRRVAATCRRHGRSGYARGCSLDSSPPVCEGQQLRTPDGAPGLLVECFAGTEFAGEPAGRFVIADTQIGFTEPPIAGSRPAELVAAGERHVHPARGRRPHAGRSRRPAGPRLFVDGDASSPTGASIRPAPARTSSG